MEFLLYSLNYKPELTGIGKYNGDLAQYLVDKKANVTVMTAPPYYPEWKVHEGFSNKFSAVNDSGVQVLRSPLYVPKSVSTLKRLLHLSSFALSSGMRLLSNLRLKPHVVFLVQPTLFCAPITLLYCKLTGALSVMHIQDFEVDAMFGLGMGKQGLSQRIARAVESWFLRRFDVVSSISYSMLENARSKGVEEKNLLFFPNWSDTNFVTPDVDGSSIRSKWGYSQEDKVILYSGNIGQKQGLEVVLDAAKHFHADPKVKFLIIGNGAYADTLKIMASDMELDNLQFKPLQPWEDIPAILSMADIHLVVQKKGAADAVLPSKLTNILSAGGHAVVTAEAHTELGKIENKYPGIYHLVEPENTASFIDGLEQLVAVETRTPNLIARQYAIDNLNKVKVIDRFISDLNARLEKNSEKLGKTHAN
ncbi:WcaI family glycosyltransferase [Neptuniibacter sp. PT34_22]|uniref:WcaI family glycosyltransferase n=1 Tax=Neptuniibacter sp. PT34_22 TaxID=3398205 RepID=UPI0039F6358E